MSIIFNDIAIVWPNLPDEVGNQHVIAHHQWNNKNSIRDLKNTSTRTISSGHRIRAAEEIIESHYLTRKCNSTIHLHNLSPALNELIESIKKTKKREAPGPDDIPMDLFKSLDADALGLVFTIVICGWEIGAFPEDKLITLVISIYRKGGLLNLANPVKSKTVRIWGLRGSGGGIFIVKDVGRLAPKLRIIIVFPFGLVTFRINFKKTRTPVIFMAFGPSGCDHDSQNQLYLVRETPICLKKMRFENLVCRHKSSGIRNRWFIWKRQGPEISEDRLICFEHLACFF